MNFAQETAFTHRVLDALSMRSKVAMHNIANQNTPGYKRYYVSFEEQLQQATKAGKPAGEVHPLVSRDTSGRPSENNVSVYDELSTLEKVKLIHEVFTKRLGGYFRHLNKAIYGR